MQQQDVYQNLLSNVRSALGVLELDKSSQLYRDAIAICDHVANPIFRIAVFGPFNYGKSTLLNALLGNRALPIDLIPTTGAAIYVKYGNELLARITLVDGTEISESGTEVLQRYAILDGDRRMRSDVADIQVFCPHTFLQTGVELMDLPGTNDREAQDTLVRDKLLTADLVVQVLDARKLMTLGERENLRDWLLDRGITTVLFVVNFMNLLEPQDQKEVSNRMRFVAESFRSELPNNISNLYRVDALPALRARLKGDMSGVHSTGLAMFESALQSIVAFENEKMAARLPRVVAIASQVRQELQAKSQALTSELETAEQKRKAKIEIKQKALKLIKQGFEGSISDFQSWLYLPKLLERYQAELAIALQQGQLKSWENGGFKEAIAERQEAVMQWVKKACEFFNKEHPGELAIAFPKEPQVSLPNQPNTSNPSSGVTPVVLATGLGWVLAGPLGAAVAGGATHLLNKTFLQDNKESSPPPNSAEISQAYAAGAEEYLRRFSDEAFETLRQYEKKAYKAISFQETEEPLEVTKQRYQLQLVRTLLDNLDREVEAASRS